MRGFNCEFNQFSRHAFGDEGTTKQEIKVAEAFKSDNGAAFLDTSLKFEA